jgi:hypothetical protein
MPVYSLPAADVEDAVATAVAGNKAVTLAQEALNTWLYSEGMQVAAGLAEGTMTEAEARTTMWGMLVRDVERETAKVRQRVIRNFTLITPREVTAGLRTMWPQCAMSSRDAGENRIEVTLPARPARDLLGAGPDYTGHAEAMLRHLLKTAVKVTGWRQVTWEGLDCTTFTLTFPLPGT